MPQNPYAEATSLLSTNPRRTIELLAGSKLNSDPQAVFLRGVAFFRLGELHFAESSFRAAIALDATRADAFYYLGLTFERRGVKADAVQAYRTALSKNPHLKEARQKLTQLGAGVEPGPTAASPKERGPLDSELTLPHDNEDEFEDYKRRKTRKAIIDHRAEFEGRLKGLPAWAKVLTAVILVGFLGLFLINFSAFRRTAADIQRRTQALQQDSEDTKRQAQQQREEIQRQAQQHREDIARQHTIPPEPQPDPSQPSPPSPGGGVPPQAQPVPSVSPRPVGKGDRPFAIPAGAVRWSVEATASNLPAAEGMVSRLASMGYPARIIAKKSGKLAPYVVRIGSYKTKSEAESVAARLSEHGLRNTTVVPANLESQDIEEIR